MSAIPETGSRRAAAATPLIEAQDLSVHYALKKGAVLSHRIGVLKAVDGVSFEIGKGRTLGLVGESGCGKSSLGRAVVGLTGMATGTLRFNGEPLQPTTLRADQRRRIQMIFQDPYASLNPRMTVGDIIAEPVIVHRLREGRAAVEDRVAELLDLVGLGARVRKRYPHEFSGGQRQRVGIARALACEPDLIVCDEAVSALDVSIQAQIILLLEKLRDRLGLTYLFISHGLGALKYISDTIAVMYLGKIVEIGPKAELLSGPRHPYTRALLSAVPLPDPVRERGRQRIILEGDPPSPFDPPAGCRFHTRCPIAVDKCRTQPPPWQTFGGSHHSACWRAHEV